MGEWISVYEIFIEEGVLYVKLANTLEYISLDKSYTKKEIRLSKQIDQSAIKIMRTLYMYGLQILSNVYKNLALQTMNDKPHDFFHL